MQPGPRTFQQQLRDLGFEGDVERTVDHTGAACMMVRAHLAECPACCQQHADDRYQIGDVLNHGHSLRNMHPTCRERIIAFAQLIQDPVLKQVLEFPGAEVPFVKLFTAHLGQTLVSDGKEFHSFDGCKWKTQSDVAVQKAAQQWLRDGLSRFHDLVKHEAEHARNNKADRKVIDSISNAVRTARQFVDSESKIRNITSALKREVMDEELHGKMDRNAFLLGTEDGVVDLQRCVWRPANPDDLVSMSVGYAWVPQPDPTLQAEVETFLRQVGFKHASIHRYVTLSGKRAYISTMSCLVLLYTMQ